MKRVPLCITEHERRRRVAETTLRHGGNMTEFAAAAGISVKAAFGWLKRHQPDLHRRLAMGPRGRQMKAHKALVRLLLIKSVEGFRGGEARLARALVLSRESLWAFKKVWAPDGLDAAIADLMPEDGAHG